MGEMLEIALDNTNILLEPSSCLAVRATCLDTKIIDCFYKSGRIVLSAVIAADCLSRFGIIRSLGNTFGPRKLEIAQDLPLCSRGLRHEFCQAFDL